MLWEQIVAAGWTIWVTHVDACGKGQFSDTT